MATKLWKATSGHMFYPSMFKGSSVAIVSRQETMVAGSSPLSPDDITVEEVLSAGNAGRKTICLQNIGQRFVCKTRWLVRWLSPAHVSRCTGWINEINENTNTGKLCDSKRRGVSEQVPWIWSHPYDRFGEPWRECGGSRQKHWGRLSQSKFEGGGADQGRQRASRPFVFPTLLHNPSFQIFQFPQGNNSIAVSRSNFFLERFIVKRIGPFWQNILQHPTRHATNFVQRQLDVTMIATNTWANFFYFFSIFFQPSFSPTKSLARDCLTRQPPGNAIYSLAAPDVQAKPGHIQASAPRGMAWEARKRRRINSWFPDLRRIQFSWLASNSSSQERLSRVVLHPNEPKFASPNGRNAEKANDSFWRKLLRPFLWQT